MGDALRLSQEFGHRPQYSPEGAGGLSGQTEFLADKIDRTFGAGLTGLSGCPKRRRPSPFMFPLFFAGKRDFAAGEERSDTDCAAAAGRSLLQPSHSVPAD